MSGLKGAILDRQFQMLNVVNGHRTFFKYLRIKVQIRLMQMLDAMR